MLWDLRTPISRKSTRSITWYRIRIINFIHCTIYLIAFCQTNNKYSQYTINNIQFHISNHSKTRYNFLKNWTEILSQQNSHSVITVKSLFTVKSLAKQISCSSFSVKPDPPIQLCKQFYVYFNLVHAATYSKTNLMTVCHNRKLFMSSCAHGCYPPCKPI